MPGTWDASRVAAILVGGAAGAVVRWAVVTTVTTGRFPWPVLAVNVAGSLLLGVLLAGEWSHPTARVLLHDAGGIGFCGGLTTFSTFSVEVVNLARDGAPATATAYALASVSATVLAVVAGATAMRHLSAVNLPLEEQP